MSTPFLRTLRALDESPTRRPRVSLVLGTLLLAGWALWFFAAHVPVHEVSRAARVEVEAASYPLAASAAGRVTASHLVLGGEVTKGQVLIELDAEAERLALAEERSRLVALAPRIVALDDELRAQTQSLDESARGRKLQADEAQALSREAEASAKLAESESANIAALRSSGVVAEQDLSRARTEAERRRAAAQGAKLAALRLERDRAAQEREREADLHDHEETLARLRGEEATSRATSARLQDDIARRSIVAPTAGKLAQVAPLESGGYVAEGQVLAVIVPRSPLRVVAQFEPRAALGRVRPGQTARIRLDGFPWPEYGSLTATVTEVASEARDGLVRVDLALKPGSTIPIEHGLPGVVEVEVERTTPARLVMRAAGKPFLTPASEPR